MTETTQPTHDPSADTELATLPNGVRVVVIRQPGRETVNVSVFVRSGSQHETPRLNGISHVAEHMAFKGTRDRNCQQINLDAERLGAEVNAHTDKNHTAFHMDGLVRDTSAFVRMLGDIVLNSTFPEDELERERQVILHELTDDEEDPLSAVFELFDRACFGDHPVAQPVIGNRRNIERVSRDDLVAHVQRLYTAGNIVVGVAGDVDVAAVVRDAAAAFGGVLRGTDNVVPPPTYVGGLKVRRLAGCAQTHAVLGFPIPSLHDDHFAHTVAAALLGEGMSSPLLDEIRERRGLAYHAACSADVIELCGQFLIEASTSPEHVNELFTQVLRLLAEQAESVDAVGLERARNQLIVRSLRAGERPARRLEAAAEDLFVHGALRSGASWRAGLAAVTADEVRAVFRQLFETTPAGALAGRIGKGVEDRVRHLLRRPEAVAA